MRRFALPILAFCIFGAPSAQAQGPLRIEPKHHASTEELLMEFVRVLRPTAENDMFFNSIVRDRLGPGTHLRIEYSSNNPVPIEFGPSSAYAYDLLSAVLPPATEGDVLLPLTSSPAWNPRGKGIFLKLYGLESSPPVITRLRSEDHLSFAGSLIASLRHPFYAERFTFAHMSEVAGYRIQGVSLSLLLGSAMIIVSVIFLKRKRRSKEVMIVCLLLLLLYEGRFLVDISSYTLALEREWWSENSLGHMGKVYAIADAVQETVQDDSDGSAVLLCTNMLATPLRYLLYPVEILEPQSYSGALPGYAVAVRTWDETTTSFSCGDVRFSGEVLRLFGDGKALVRIFPSAE